MADVRPAAARHLACAKGVRRPGPSGRVRSIGVDTVGGLSGPAGAGIAIRPETGARPENRGAPSGRSSTPPAHPDRAHLPNCRRTGGVEKRKIGSLNSDVKEKN